MTLETNESEKLDLWAELWVEGWYPQGVSPREWQVGGPMARGPRGGGAARDGGAGAVADPRQPWTA